MSDREQMKEVMSYLIGYRLGSQVLPQMVPGVEAEDVVGQAAARGLVDGIAGRMDPSVGHGQAERFQQEFFSMLHQRREKRAEENLQRGRRYMEENGARSGVQTTSSGLQYEILAPGGSESYCAEKHGEAPTAEVMYKGTLVDGTVFDQSQKPVKFNIRQVIPGFTEALTLMPVGARWKVTIPAHLAYGAHGPGSIGPNSTLIFEMELLGFIPGR